MTIDRVAFASQALRITRVCALGYTTSRITSPQESDLNRSIIEIDISTHKQF